jgi:flagellar biosynthesis/type III secretory pathway protein FliH
MRLFNIKSLVGAAALGLVLIAGVSDASAQGRNQVARNQQRVIKQQQQMQKAQLKLQQERLRLERQRLQTIQAQNRYRVNRNGSWYNTDRRGADLLRQAVNEGYRQGFAAGRSDRNRQIRQMNWSGSSMYRSGTLGWQSYVDRGQYQHYFRQGFERGYQDGFNSRNQYGTNNNGVVNILGSILGSILNVQQY